MKVLTGLYIAESLMNNVADRIKIHNMYIHNTKTHLLLECGGSQMVGQDPSLQRGIL